MVHCYIFSLLLMFRHDKTVSEGCGLGRSGLSDRRHASRNIWWAFVHRAVSQRRWHRWSRHHHHPAGEKQHKDMWNAVHVPGSCFYILWSALHYKNKILKKDSNKKICIKKKTFYFNHEFRCIDVRNKRLSHLTESKKKIVDFLHANSEVELSGVKNL